MPEGHVTHRLALELTSHFAGQAVHVSSPQGRFADAAQLLDGTRLDGSQAVGKHLFVEFEADRIVWIHLGLIGKMRFVPVDQLRSPETLRLRIEPLDVDDCQVAGTPLQVKGDAVVELPEASSADLEESTRRVPLAVELRGPQWCRLITPDEQAAVIVKSGPDPLRADADPEQAWRKVHAAKRAIGQLLMDQAVFAGVGNIFRAEVLFRHHVDPNLPAKKLPRPVFDSMWADLVQMMHAAVASGQIDSVDAEYSPEAMHRPPRVDAHGGEVYVYRRAGQPCLVCGTQVAMTQMASRNLYWCPSCQPAGSMGEPIEPYAPLTEADS